MNRTKILYVEDEPFLGRIVKESLESRDFDVCMATDGKAAVDIYRKEQPNICVIDIMLPLKDGYSAAKEIRQLDTNVPIIFVTAKNQTEDVIKGFEVGGNDKYIPYEYPVVSRKQHCANRHIYPSQLLCTMSFISLRVAFRKNSTFKCLPISPCCPLKARKQEPFGILLPYRSLSIT